MANDKKSGTAMVKNDPADLTINAPMSAPEGYERSVRGSGFVGYWRAQTGDVLSCILRGPAPEAVIEKSQSKHGVALVELVHEAIVSSSKRQLEGKDMSRWVPGPLNRKGEETMLTKCVPGEIICVSIREGIKEEMMLADGTKVWLKVGKIRPIPGSDNTMYDYEKYVQGAGGGKGGGGNARSGSNPIPFD
jgi:hypothetical protein